jgi:uncharacterized membrane protein HdeD (DUF308 family)
MTYPEKNLKRRSLMMSLFDQTYALLVRFHPFFMGIICTLAVIAALLFFRFYRKTADRLFLFFSAAFALMAINRVALQITNSPTESQPLLYLIRLLAFALILYAIVDKNRSNPLRKTPPR